ncbi:hypothetical protein [Streptomyces mangrovisoli]|uniref:Uncharacterized protein n=1 Tax=Streptomyces mangrovisoli TaxID=1428628 RepID=A0A1J4NP05_9ACTN|nr:hypothetical protein [Streptomyces mangrovisoli]OIJ63858.1 hypothetical protein WN71_031070 [Streptomyces mangrovisoli]
MSVPEIVPITHEPGHRTATIGRYAQGQFFASATYASPRGSGFGEGWEERQRLYAVLHRFDFEGRHVHSVGALNVLRAGLVRRDANPA